MASRPSAAVVESGIRFHLPARATELVSFAYSPVFEAALSLRVVAGPKHHALQHGWVRRVRRLPVDLRKRVDAFRFAVFTDVPDFLLPSTEGGFLFRGRARPFTSARPGARRVRVPAPALRSRRRASARAAPRCNRAGARRRRRGATRRRSRARSPDLRRPRRAARAISRSAVGLVDCRLRKRRRARGVRARPAVSSLGRDHGRNKLSLVVSAYVWPHVRVNCNQPFPISLVIPARFLARDLRPQLADSELLQLLRAIGEETRLRALQLIAEAPRSTRELGPLLDISEAGLSKHLCLLADAGVLESHREGYYVVYELAPERLDQISRTLVDYVNRPGLSS